MTVTVHANNCNINPAHNEVHINPVYNKVHRDKHVAFILYYFYCFYPTKATIWVSNLEKNEGNL